MPEEHNELYKLIAVSGPDKLAFLQGQLTQDVSLVSENAGLLAAWCNAKGRVMVTLHLVETGDSVGLVVPASMADRAVQRLRMYRLRAKVDISEPSDDWADLIDAQLADPHALILAGIPVVDDRNTEAYTPHMLNLDKLGAISFTKGCYTGQEVVARTEHLGKARRRLMRYEADKDGIAVGDKVSDGERNIGDVVNIVDRNLLAVTPVDLHDRVLTIGAASLQPKGLPYQAG